MPVPQLNLLPEHMQIVEKQYLEPPRSPDNVLSFPFDEDYETVQTPYDYSVMNDILFQDYELPQPKNVNNYIPMNFPETNQTQYAIQQPSYAQQCNMSQVEDILSYLGAESQPVTSDDSFPFSLFEECNESNTTTTLKRKRVDAVNVGERMKKSTTKSSLSAQKAKKVRTVKRKTSPKVQTKTKAKTSKVTKGKKAKNAASPEKKTRSKTQSSKYRGVSRCSKDGRWQARIRIGSTVKYLGRFRTEIEAAECYDVAACQYHGERAVPNFKPRPVSSSA